MYRRHWLKGALTIALSGVAGRASAHEPMDPKHGGRILVAADLDFEIVQRGDDLIFYIEDHGELVSTEGASSTVTVIREGRPVEVKLSPMAPNALVASATRPVAGTAVVVVIKLRRPADLTFRFVAR